MSILNGTVSEAALKPASMPYGKVMTETTCIDQLSMDAVAFRDDILLCGGKDRISLHRINKDGKTTQISVLNGLRATRQIGICDDFAYVSSRENGVYICDLRDMNQPRLAYHLDVLEMATGIAVSNGLLAITNRHMGCELFDVRNPYQPKRLGDFLCGEAQSVWLHQHYALIGDWMNKQVLIFDISDPRHAKKISHFNIDGFADGVCVFQKGGQLLCLAAAGHHSARLKNRRKYKDYNYVTAEMLAEGYGGGHGVEIFDITNLSMPEWLATLKTPPHFGGYDTWRVYSDGNTCVFTDSMNGIFTISLKNLLEPVFTGHYRLQLARNQKLTPPSIQLQTNCITGAAVVSGFLCAASSDDGIHILRPNQAMGHLLVSSCQVNLDLPPENHHVFYQSKGQIHNFVPFNGRIYCASGNQGIEVLDESGKLLYVQSTKGICHDLILHRGKLYSSEENQGIGVYEIADSLSECDRLLAQCCIRQITPTEFGFVAQCDSANLAGVLLDENGHMELIDKGFGKGVLYHRHLSRTLAGNYVVALPLRSGATLVTLDQKELHIGESFGFEACPFAGGACGYGDKLLLIHDNRYACLDDPSDIANTVPMVTVEGALLSGIPYLLDDRLVLLNRYTGIAEVLDVSDPHNPRFLSRVETDAYPEACQLINGEIYIACGFGGIIKL